MISLIISQQLFIVGTSKDVFLFFRKGTSVYFERYFCLSLRKCFFNTLTSNFRYRMYLKFDAKRFESCLKKYACFLYRCLLIGKEVEVLLEKCWRWRLISGTKCTRNLTSNVLKKEHFLCNATYVVPKRNATSIPAPFVFYLTV